MQDAREAAASASDIFSPQSLRVLVCDSKASARQDIVRLLRECSYQVGYRRLCGGLSGLGVFGAKGVATPACLKRWLLGPGAGRQVHGGGPAGAQSAASPRWEELGRGSYSQGARPSPQQRVPTAGAHPGR